MPIKIEGPQSNIWKANLDAFNDHIYVPSIKCFYSLFMPEKLKRNE